MTIEEAIKSLKSLKSFHNGSYGTALELAIKALEKEPKTGHWEKYGDSWENKFKCSECGKEQPKILCGERIIGHWSDYCPYCGARMEDGSDEE